MALRGEAGTATLTLSGLVLLQRTGRVPLVRYSNRSAEAQARGQSAMLLGRLLATEDNRLGWNPGKARVRWESPLSGHAGTPSPETSVGRGATARGETAWTARIGLPDLVGRIAGHAYLTRGIVATLTLNGPRNGMASADAPNGWLWAEGEPTPAVLILGVSLSETAVTAGSGLADAATILGATAGHHGAGPVAATAASWTPVQIGG